MRRFYSYVVFSPEEMGFPEHLLMLGKGPNAFNVSLEDSDAFNQLLLQKGVKIIRGVCLDEHEAITPDPGILAEAMGTPLLGR